jgi:hypothetical protein
MFAKASHGRTKQNNRFPGTQLGVDAAQGMYLDLTLAIDFGETAGPENNGRIAGRWLQRVRLSRLHGGTPGLQFTGSRHKEQQPGVNRPTGEADHQGPPSRFVVERLANSQHKSYEHPHSGKP